MTNSRIEVELRLWGFASSVEETLRAIEGSRIWQAGDLRAGSSVLHYQDSLWSLDSRCEASAPLSQHVDDICSRLASHWDALTSIALAS